MQRCKGDFKRTGDSGEGIFKAKKMLMITRRTWLIIWIDGKKIK